jgi:hypothetical protein
VSVLVNIYCILTEVILKLTEVFLTLTEGFPCFFVGCKANARAKLTKTGTARTIPHYYYLCCSFVLCVVLGIVCV